MTAVGGLASVCSTSLQLSLVLVTPTDIQRRPVGAFGSFPVAATCSRRHNAREPADGGRMKTTGKAADVSGVIREDEMYLLSVAESRLRVGRKAMHAAQRAGLRTIQFSRSKYVTGRELLRFFGELERKQHGEGDGESDPP